MASDEHKYAGSSTPPVWNSYRTCTLHFCLEVAPKSVGTHSLAYKAFICIKNSVLNSDSKPDPIIKDFLAHRMVLWHCTHAHTHYTRPA